MADDYKTWCSCWKRIFELADAAMSEAGQSGETDVKVFMKKLRKLQQQVATGTLDNIEIVTDLEAQIVAEAQIDEARNSINKYCFSKGFRNVQISKLGFLPYLLSPLSSLLSPLSSSHARFQEFPEFGRSSQTEVRQH